MDFLLVGAFANYALGFSLFFISLFLIFIILIQRGRGGGLSGALGGTGQSAFGSRAGDEMTYITLIVSAIWIFLCVVCIWVLNPKDPKQFFNDDNVEQTSGEAGAGLNLGGGEDSGEGATGTDGGQDTSGEDSGEEATGTDGGQDTSGEDSGEGTTGTDGGEDGSGEEEADVNTTPDGSDDGTPEPPTSEETSSDDSTEPGDEPAEPESDGSNPDKPG
jgi:preprotein translocase subunit SecG